MKSEEMEKQLNSLTLGDYIRVSWFDASEARLTLSEHQKPECLVDEWGIFLGVEGDPKHLLLGQHYVSMDRAWEATRIPITLIRSIQLIAKHASPQAFLRRYIVRNLKKHHSVMVKDNWTGFERR